MRNISTPRASDWHEYGTAAANNEVVVTRSAPSSGVSHKITSFEASFSATGNGELDLYGLTKVGPLDLTDTSVLNLSTDKFTLAGNGLSNADQVVFHTLGGTAPTGLTSGNTYFAVGVSGNDFQLEASVGGGAINMSGTQANFATGALILPLVRSWEVYDHLELSFSSPLHATPNAPVILKLEAVSALIGKVNMTGYSL